MTKVSVVVPVYNAALFLNECMDSIVRQTLKDIEIICVNDGSTDASGDILKSYADRDARIKVIEKENAGYGNAMNVGMDAATGEYIGIVEPDDQICPIMYERLYKIAKKLALDIIKADYYRFSGDRENRKIEYISLSKNKEYYKKVIDPKNHPEIFKFVMSTWTGIYRRKFLVQNSIYHNETPGAAFQDNGFWFQTFCLAQRVYFLNEPFYMYRRDNPASSVHSREKVYSICEEYDFIYRFLLRNPELKMRFIYVYSLKRFHNYQFTLERIGEEYRGEFLQRYSRDFYEAKKRGELKREYFIRSDWRILHKIMYSPEAYEKEFRRKGNRCYKLSYYFYNFGIRKTLLKIAEILFKKVRCYGKGIRYHSSL